MRIYKTGDLKHYIFYGKNFSNRGLRLLFAGVFISMCPRFCLVGSNFRSPPLRFLIYVQSSKTFCSRARGMVVVLLSSSLFLHFKWELSFSTTDFPFQANFLLCVAEGEFLPECCESAEDFWAQECISCPFSILDFFNSFKRRIKSSHECSASCAAL